MTDKSRGVIAIALTEAEAELVAQAAKVMGCESVEEAGAVSIEKALAKRVRDKRGKTPAKVYSMRGKS